MELLNSIVRQPVEPGYRDEVPVARHRGYQGLVVVITAVAGLMFGTSAVRFGGTSWDSGERTQLIDQVEHAKADNDALKARIQELNTEIQSLEANANPGTENVTVAMSAGGRSVTGPGIRVEISDSPDDPNGVIVDQDMRQVVNALWQAGAEAIAINGHRLSARTAIRQAGTAITVDYRSMTTPYRIEAIGDPATLSRNFESGTGAAWLNFLKRNYRVAWQVQRVDALNLPADPGLGITVARPQ